MRIKIRRSFRQVSSQHLCRLFDDRTDVRRQLDVGDLEPAFSSPYPTPYQGRALPRFVEEVLAPALRPGDVDPHNLTRKWGCVGPFEPSLRVPCSCENIHLTSFLPQLRTLMRKAGARRRQNPRE
jgi:hypothetical protein